VRQAGDGRAIAAVGLQHADGRPVDGGRVQLQPAQLRAERVHKTGTALRVRPAGGQDAGAVRVAGGAQEGTVVAGRAG